MQEIVKAENLSVRLGGRNVLEKISFLVGEGELTGVIGPNGAGKTTLLRAILGLIPISQGRLEVLGSSHLHLKKVRPLVGYMSQRKSYEKNIPLSVADVVFTGLLTPATILRRVNKGSLKIKEALQAVGMEGFADRSFHELSGGEQQRVLLARALVRKPALLLLDEPNAGLDFPAQRKFNALLRELRERDKLTIILVSHDLFSVASTADQLICINCVMHTHGQPGEVLNSPTLDEVYRCQFDLLREMERERRDRR
ncbi:MAG TPA: metal ABC transporter ATP-binding protein [Firmicutes bacterium]|nr:metal ABC transporter ATP-binding protein [Bacillota bacterium]